MSWPLLLALFAAFQLSSDATERNVTLSSFDRIRIDGPFDVSVGTGGARAIVRGSRRAVEAVDVRQEGRTLIISASQNQSGGWPGEVMSGAVTIEVASPSLRSAAVVGSGRLGLDHLSGASIQLSVTGAGVIAVRDIDTDQLLATIIGSGSIAVQGHAATARFLSNGTGDIDASGMVADDLTVRSESSGSSKFNARYSANVTSLGLGEVRVDGNPACKIQGQGPIFCGLPGDAKQ